MEIFNKKNTRKLTSDVQYKLQLSSAPNLSTVIEYNIVIKTDVYNLKSMADKPLYIKNVSEKKS